MAKIALPITDGLLSERFSHSAYFEIVKISGKNIQANSKRVVSIQSVEDLDQWIKELGITDIIAHKMDKVLVDYFSSTKINLFIGVALAPSEQLIEDYLKGELKSDAKAILSNVGYFKY